MAAITASMVGALRAKTDAPMMECKKALTEADGDMDKAEELLRVKLGSKAGKAASRIAAEGVVAATVEGTTGALIEVNCETDFVTKNDSFLAFAKSLSALVAEKNPADVAALSALPLSQDGFGPTVEDVRKGLIGKIGENMQVARFEKVEGGLLGSYIHPGAQLGVLVQMTGASAATGSNEEIQELLRDVAMQVAAADPQFARRDEVTPAVLDRERAIQKDRARQEGKPEAIIDKMIEGRMSKFFEEFCLLEQPFIKDNALTVGQLVTDKAKKVGEPLAVARFIRYKVGETAPADAPAEA